jgi:uncharacterized phage protein (TIGR01671 family)
MREIKFRVWYKPSKQFLNHCSVGNGIIQHDSQHYAHLEEDECVIQQYTGLKDRNGTEIYEGDIVRVDPGWLYNFKHTGEIYWCDVNLGFYYKCPFHQINWDINKYFVCEVVGNNYE